MAGRLLTRAIGPAARRIPGVRRLPVFSVIAACEVALLAHEHLKKLEPAERRRVLELVREGRGRGRNLPGERREELAALIAKTEMAQFLRTAAERLSPVPLPRRLLGNGARRSSTAATVPRPDGERSKDDAPRT